MRTLIASLVALTLVAGLSLTGIDTASAQQSFEENIVVVQQRPFIRQGRFEVAPFYALSTNDDLILSQGVGGYLNYHILEWLAVGGSYTKYFSQNTDLYHDIERDFRIYPEKWELDFYAGGHVQGVPFAGKAILFNSWIFHWDVYATLGFGVTRSNLSDNAFTGNVGLGTRIYLTKWLTLNLEFRDYIYTEKFRAGDELVNNVMLQAGLSVFIPFGFDYRYPK